MSTREQYTPGPAVGAKVASKEGDIWTLVLVRDLRHAPEKVWNAITDPAQLREWAPFDSDQSLSKLGTAKLTTVGAPQLHVTEATVKRADRPKVLEYNWGEWNTRWELEATSGGGTRLTLWAGIDRRYIAMGAAGWHVCFDVMDAFLAGKPIGRTVGPDAMKINGWQRLLGEYAKELRAEVPNWGNAPTG